MYPELSGPCWQEQAAAPQPVEEQSPDSAELFDVIDVFDPAWTVPASVGPFVRRKIAASLCQLRSSLEAHQTCPPMCFHRFPTAPKPGRSAQLQ